MSSVVGSRRTFGSRKREGVNLGLRVFVLSVFAVVSNGVDTCEVAQCRFDDGCCRPLCPYRHSGRGRAAMWARVWLTLAAVVTERLAPQESTWRQEPEGEAEVPKLSCRMRSEAPKWTFVAKAFR